jgi:hypothetical protein
VQLATKQKELQLSNYKFSEMESICYSLRQDLNSIQYLSEEIERLNFTVKDRD